MLETKRMPPEDADQPPNAVRTSMVQAIRNQLDHVAKERSGDPGRVVMRRLTGAEFNYVVRDLTGLNLQLESELPGDAVGGEGFANIGIVQFMQDSTLEQYLQTARRIAEHAVIGAGPIQFFKDPGKTGFELSAIDRIQAIYRSHGFRTGAGEGGEPFGMDRYPKAFFVAWLFKHREALGLHDATIDTLSIEHTMDSRFVHHLWSVLNDRHAVFPTREIAGRWANLPGPNDESLQEIRLQCDELYLFLQGWQKRLSDRNTHFEEAVVLDEQDVKLSSRHDFSFRTEIPEEQKVLRLHFRAAPVDASTPDPIVSWQDLKIEFRRRGRRWDRPLDFFRVAKLVDSKADPDAESLDAKKQFVTSSSRSIIYEIEIPPSRINVRFAASAQLDLANSPSKLALCAVTQEPNDWQSHARLIVDPESDSISQLTRGIRRFVRDLPQISQREPAPSDRDPIPEPFDPTYNNPERDHFHYKVKYYRDDKFLVDKVLDDATRKQLDQAWCDLLTSFEYHDIFLKFTANKFQIDLPSERMEDITPEWVERIHGEPGKIISRLLGNWNSYQIMRRDAEASHLADMLQFASQAWRRPLTSDETRQLMTFYETQRQEHAYGHADAIRATIVRVLMSPRFLFRSESPENSGGRLSSWEIGSRLSFLLWASIPDQELREMAASEQLNESQYIEKQVARMLRDPKAIRFAHEFFGQWFGFYRFDKFDGVDVERFPEFTNSLKHSMFESANRFFGYIVRNDRPIREILFSDYTFVNKRLAEYYGLEPPSESGFHRLTAAGKNHRGGLLGLGAVLTTTSAPLRTSPVKRGDWILRRVIGTPVPPPPADAGSIAADDITGDGLTVGQRLAAHRRDASCASCHTRIDPLGFALENFDAIGRWRERYRDGQSVENSGVLINGESITGPEGLREYLRQNEHLFFETFCQKLLGFALGRSVLLSDSKLIEDMLVDIKADAPFSTIVTRIVSSPQFRNSQSIKNE